MAIDDTKISIGGDSTGAERALDRVSRGFKKLNGDVSDFSKQTGFAAATIGKLAAAGLSLGTVALGAKAIKDTADFADEMVKAAQKVGTTIEALSGLRYAADLSGVSFEQLQTGLGKLAQAQANFERGSSGAIQAFNALRLDPTRFEDSAELFEAVAEQLSKMPDGTAKTALAMELLGKSGAQLIPLLNGGRDGIRAMREEAEALGIIMTKDTAAAAEQFNDDMSRMATAAQGLKFQLGRALLPAMAEISKATAEAAREGGLLHGIWVGLGATMAHILGLDEASKAKAALQDVNDQIATLTAQLNTGRLNPDGLSGGFWDFIFPANILSGEAKSQLKSRLDELVKERDRLSASMAQTANADGARVDAMQKFSKRAIEAKELELQRLQGVFAAQKKALAAAEKDLEAAAERRKNVVKEFQQLQKELSAPAGADGKKILGYEVEKAVSDARNAQELAARAPAEQASQLADEAIEKARAAGELLKQYKDQQLETGSSIDAASAQTLVDKLAGDLVAIADQAAAVQEQLAQQQVATVQQLIQDTLNQAEALKALQIGFDENSAKQSLQDMIAQLREQAQNNPIKVPATIVSGSLPDKLDGIEGKAGGGPIYGPGPKGRDSRLIMAAPGEHMLTAREVDAAGGHAAIYRLRRALLSGRIPQFANGGAIGGLRVPSLPAISAPTALQPIDLTIPGIGRYRVQAAPATAGSLQRDLAMEALKFGGR